MFKLDLEKAEEPEIKLIIEKAREFQKNIYFCFIDYAKTFDFVDHNKLCKVLQEMRIPDHLTRPLNMEQKTAFKLGKKYVKAVYCHPAYLTYMQSTS